MRSDAVTSDEVLQSARLWNFDTYLAATLAPRDVQRDVLALTAFVGELEHIRLSVSEPGLAQIRIQWWRDELQRMVEVGRSDHPIGTALLSAIHAHDLPLVQLLGVVDAVFDLVSGARFSDDQLLNAWFGKRFAAPIGLIARCSARHDGGDGDLVSDVGRLCGLCWILSQFRRGADPVSEFGLETTEEVIVSDIRETMGGAARRLKVLPRPARVAFLPGSLAPLYLRHPSGQPGALSKVCRMASAHWLGRYQV